MQVAAEGLDHESPGGLKSVTNSTVLSFHVLNSLMLIGLMMVKSCICSIKHINYKHSACDSRCYIFNSFII